MTPPASQTPSAGWYPDPSGQPGERWWNGTAWSQDTRPSAPAAAPPAPATGAPAAWDGFGNPVAPPVYDATASTYGAGVPVGSTPPPYAGGPAGGGYGPQGHGGAPGGGDGRSVFARNGYSIATVGVAVAYLLALVYAHLAVIGILPLFLGVRAVRRKEPLGVVAVVIGVLAFVFGIYEYSR